MMKNKKQRQVIKMYEVTYSINGIIKRISINAGDSLTAQNMFTSMFSGENVDIINIVRR